MNTTIPSASIGSPSRSKPIRDPFTSYGSPSRSQRIRDPLASHHSTRLKIRQLTWELSPSVPAESSSRSQRIRDPLAFFPLRVNPRPQNNHEVIYPYHAH